MRVKRERPVRQIARVVWQHGKGLLLLDATCAVLLGLVPWATLMLQKDIIDSIVSMASAGAFSLPRLAPVLVLLGAAYGVTVLLGGLQNALGPALRLGVQQEVSMLVLQRLQGLDYSSFEDPAFQNDLYVANQNAPAQLSNLLSQVTAVGRGAVTTVAFLGSMLAAIPEVGLVALLSITLPVYLQTRTVNERFRWQTGVATLSRRMSYLSGLFVAPPSVREFRTSPPTLILERLERHNHDMLQETAAVSRRLAQYGTWGTVFSMAGTIVSYTLIGGACVAGKITVGGLAAFMQMTFQIQQSLMSTVASIRGLQEAAVYVRALLRVLGFRAEPREAPPAVPTSRPRLSLRDVSFRYPGTKPEALSHVSLEIEPGHKLALVGPNGAGKSTVLKLILGLYRPTSGSVVIDGQEVSALSEAARSKLFTVLQQDYVRYLTSIRENVAFSDPRQLNNRQALDEVAMKVGLLDKILATPGGWDTALGREYGGLELSLGEWQRLAIARMLVKEAPFLVIDEPTSAIDPSGEAAILEAILEAAQDRTLILVTHRISWAQRCDVVAVVSEGAVAETGSPEALLSAQGPYYQMFRAQAGALLGH